MLWITAMQGSAPPQAGKKQMVSKNIAEEMYSVYTVFQGIKLHCWGMMWTEVFSLKNFGEWINKMPLKLEIDNMI